MNQKNNPAEAQATIDRQREIYLKGVSGERPKIPIDQAELERRAGQQMAPEAFAYVACGAGLEDTVKRNRSAFEDWRILPRMLRDVSDRDTSVELFGRRLDYPFLLSPIGVLEMAHKEADLAVARAAGGEDTLMIYSNQASTPMEKCAEAMEAVKPGAPRWFQLYWSKSDELVKSLVSRAEACGCEAIVVTLDTTLLGWRTRDLDLAYLPFLRGKGIAQYTSDPVFLASLDEIDPSEMGGDERRITLATLKTVAEMGLNFPDGLLRGLSTGKAMAAVQQFVNIYSRPSLTWENLAFLREHTELPILLKGILHPEDARLAVRYGVDGIIVSNHGGRQVDGAISTIEALPGVVSAVGGQMPVIMDSGVRGGADIFKALSLGATAVGIGRPYCYALAIAGEDGVRELIQNLKADFELTMALAGCRTIDEIDRNCLRSDKQLEMTDV